ncbi:glycosyltransferase family 2 protein [Candidatus Borrarchaeum sp.]|uniref:glycosyltransferase family 2 protein n=1 Tax=Candidatus Borrarchaeum sp. TaxID=2846742 RepID=UPI00257A2D36|nr:glycosyltransferase family 2 protein [Candidatus Borrarchaeum sp.]
MNSNNPFLSIVIPAYNEAISIPNVILNIPKDLLDKSEIIVVDDGSEDDTYEIAKKLNAVVIKHILNRGYGAALLTGFEAALGNIIVTIDADNQNRAAEIPNLINPILENEADFVIGSRYLGEYNYRIPFLTKIGEMLTFLLLRIRYRKRILNSQSGFRAFKREILHEIKTLREEKMALTIELLAKALKKKYRVIEIPKTEYKRKYGKSKVNRLIDGFNILYTLLKNLFR